MWGFLKCVFYAWQAIKLVFCTVRELIHNIDVTSPASESKIAQDGNVSAKQARDVSSGLIIFVD